MGAVEPRAGTGGSGDENGLNIESQKKRVKQLGGINWTRAKSKD